jgi:hypothetical protein
LVLFTGYKDKIVANKNGILEAVNIINLETYIMKKNDYLLLAATAAYSFLFYRQAAGINFLLFTAIFITLLIVKNVKLLKSKKWLFSALFCLLSAVSVVVHSSDLSIIGNVISLVVLSAFSVNVATSAIFSFLFGFYSILSSVAYIILDAIKRSQPKDSTSKDKSGIKVFATFIVLLISLLFFNMYKSSNPLFAENTKWINFDFISIPWITFTLGGFILTYALLYSKTITPVEAWENKLSLSNPVSVMSPETVKRFETERYAGLLLFVMLNLMLVLLNVGDIQTLYFNGGLPANVSHSDFVHSGVGILILSILIATSFIMYLSRKEFNDVKNNRALLACIYLWILQNLVMLSSTAFRNQIYIHEYNFTYKRVGVYVWLLLAMCGLCIMFWKMHKKRSNWYLVRSNISLWFIVLVISGFFNWDKLITRYNIQNKPLSSVDFHYLFCLSDANIPELMAVTRQPGFPRINATLKNYTGDALTTYHSETYTGLLHDKVYSYLLQHYGDWRSFDLREKEVMKSLFAK